MKVILLNGPPGSGKDTAAVAIEGAAHIKLAASLKDATHALFGFSGVSTAAFEAVKNETRPEFFGMTPRQAYISVSEKMAKPALGTDFFGRVLARQIIALGQRGVQMVVISDAGFATEIQPIVAAVGAANVLLVRLHRAGHNFANDSRSYVDIPGIAVTDVENDADVEELRFRVCMAVDMFAQKMEMAA